MSEANTSEKSLLEAAKFRDPQLTAKGEIRASVHLTELKTLWFNTGTLCNLMCSNCYIESSPTNDRLVYLTVSEVIAFLDELDYEGSPLEEVAFTGGEPFMNPDMVAMAAVSLERGYSVLILTNAMRPMLKCADNLLKLQAQHGDRLTLRVSLDHYSQPLHDLYRGERAYERALDGIRWLSSHGFRINLAGRTFWNESEKMLRDGFERLCTREEISVDSCNPSQLILFPEMDETRDVPEITDTCWSLLNVDPEDMMCATSRMIVKRKGEDRPVVLPCTLLPYDLEFELGDTLTEAESDVRLNHPRCSRFCVLGGGSCS
jgi:sulfatase maturation enzyme AslB (radical SAM superfamily)